MPVGAAKKTARKKLQGGSIMIVVIAKVSVIPEKKQELLALTLATYVGNAATQAKDI